MCITLKIATAPDKLAMTLGRRPGRSVRGYIPDTFDTLSAGGVLTYSVQSRPARDEALDRKVMPNAYQMTLG